MIEDTAVDIKGAALIPQGQISAEVKQAVHEAQLLVSFVAREGMINVEKEGLDTIIRSKYLLQEDKWTIDAEVKFWQTFDKITNQIKPVTMESLRATVPVYNESSSGKKKPQTRAAKTVQYYRILTIGCLLLLLISQIYWVVGSDLNQKMQSIFDQRENMIVDLERIKAVTKSNKKNGDNLSEGESIDKTLVEKKIDSELEILNQRLDASYELLCGWNRIWQVILFKDQFVGKVTPYIEYEFENSIAPLETRLEEIEKLDQKQAATKKEKERIDRRIRGAKLEHQLDKARNKLFLTEMSAGFVLNAFQVYILPLLYGFLGAATFVLRTLSIQVKNLTYSDALIIGYRLRISLGGLAGMAIGWFLKPEEGAYFSSLPPMALAFLVGYNVDVLFTLMDKLILSLAKWNQDEEEPSPSPVPPPPPEEEKPVEDGRYIFNTDKIVFQAYPGEEGNYRIQQALPE